MMNMHIHTHANESGLNRSAVTTFSFT